MGRLRGHKLERSISLTVVAVVWVRMSPIGSCGPQLVVLLVEVWEAWPYKRKCIPGAGP